MKIHKRIYAAEDEFDITDDMIESTDGFEDTLDTLADNVQDVQDTVDEIQEDDTNIEIDNNIADHYIAECERCHGVFISAVIESDQDINSITGICPLCDHETTQDLKWIIKDVE